MIYLAVVVIVLEEKPVVPGPRSRSDQSNGKTRYFVIRKPSKKSTVHQLKLEETLQK
jgi:hypothetical protein